TYEIAPAEASGLPDDSVDLVLVAQALHWFDLDRFYAEVRRVARHGAAIVAISYGVLRGGDDIDPVIDVFRALVDGDWPPERVHVEAGYATLPFPFAPLATPAFAMSADWDADQLLGYFSTWSATRRHVRRTGHDPVAAVRDALHAAWGPPRPRTI